MSHKHTHTSFSDTFYNIIMRDIEKINKEIDAIYNELEKLNTKLDERFDKIEAQFKNAMVKIIFTLLGIIAFLLSEFVLKKLS